MERLRPAVRDPERLADRVPLILVRSRGGAADGLVTDVGLVPSGIEVARRQLGPPSGARGGLGYRRALCYNRHVPDFNDLPWCDESGNVRVVVETPRGSSCKVKYDPRTGAFLFERSLLLGVTYPYDWGFVPGTQADGDPLDAMVLLESATWPGVVIASRPLGVVRLTQRKPSGASRLRNDRVIAVPAGDPRHADASGVSKRVRAELEEFFVSASRLTGKEVVVEGWAGTAAARAAIGKAARDYARRRGAV